MEYYLPFLACDVFLDTQQLKQNGTTLKKGLGSGCNEQTYENYESCAIYFHIGGMGPEKTMLLSEHSLVLALPN